MIVLDASAAIELLLNTPTAVAIGSRLRGETLSAPHIIDLEIAHVFRRHARMGTAIARLEQSLLAWRSIVVFRHAHEPYLSRIWALRGGFSAYDAAYIALAEALGAPLVTHDAKLASAGHSAVVEVI